MIQINIELDEKEVRKILLDYLNNNVFDSNNQLELKDISIMVKSKQNYKSEWEIAEFKATVNRQK